MDIIEMKIDRTEGSFSLRVFRDLKWLDFGVAFSDDIWKTGDVYFGVSLYFTGDTIKIVNKPREIND